jgi:adenosylmethionine-8-amino-7-oxononanoate aminotransferase
LAKQDVKSLVDRDAAVIWHPYTQHQTVMRPIPVVKGEGVYIIDETGNKYIDATSSWWTNLHGHAHPYIAKKIFEQAEQLEHVIFAGCTHEPAVKLAERLLPLMPGKFSKVFYSDNGSTAVEVALKMAIQYWKNIEGKRLLNGEGPRKKIIAFKHSYHGDTFGAMSVSERGVFTMNFENYLFEVIFIDTPTPENISHLLVEIDSQTEIAAFIYEPLLQAAGGMRIYDAPLLNDILRAFRKKNVICIADEVMTGFGRTGKIFSSEFIDEKPDIICISKGITGGSLPLAITACTENIYDAFLSDDLRKTFFHGHSYTANPLGCAAALASLDLLQKEECRQNIEYISERHKQFIEKINKSSFKNKIKNPRSLGTVFAFEFDSSDSNYLNKIREEIMKMALQKGVLLRPLGNTIYIMPPYCISQVQLEKIYASVESILANL